MEQQPRKPRRPPTTERGGARREQILKVALRLFAEQGIAGTGLRQIAQEVGIAQPALYHYFASKEQLFTAIVEWREEAMKQRFPAATFAPPPGQTLRQGLVAYTDQFLQNWSDPDNLRLHQVIFAELSRGSGLSAELHREFVEPQISRLTGLFERLQAAGKIRELSPGLLALQFVSPLLMAAMVLGAGNGPVLSQLVYQHLEVFIRGVETRR